jgi:magnesium transporter
MKSAGARLRRLGADYLVYAILHLLVDRYFVVLDRIGSLIEELEEELVGSPGQDVLHPIRHLRREMILGAWTSAGFVIRVAGSFLEQ